MVNSISIMKIKVISCTVKKVVLVMTFGEIQADFRIRTLSLKRHKITLENIHNMVIKSNMMYGAF